jgi:hypothetical protein
MTLTTRTSMIAFAILASALTDPAVAAEGNPARRTVAPQSIERTLVGAWQTRVRPRNCETGEVAPIAGLRGLFTFHEGGTASEYGVPPGMTPAMRSPGHGVWRREPGWQTYTFAFTYYRYDVSGAYAGQQRVTSVLELDASGDAFVANSSIEGFDANDNLILTACGQAVGSRFQ